MKKVKTLLVTAVAALSLTSCNYQDAINWAKNAGGQVGGFFTSLLEKFGLKQKGEKKEEACKHEDKNHDGKCDLCGEEGLEVVHVDENQDHKCDVCGSVVSEHADADNDFKCDICGKELEIVNVELDTSAAQINFSKGEQFSSDGVKVIATSEVGSKKELEFTVSEVDTSTVGEKTVVVTYGEGENDKFEYTINVSYWSQADLAVFSAASLTGFVPLPYLAGFNMRTVATWEGEGENAEVKEWSILADDITSDAFLEFNNMLKAYSGTATVSGYPVTFELEAVSRYGTDNVYGLTDVNLYQLVPYVAQGGHQFRLFTSDEYLAVGINADGQLVVKSRVVDTTFEHEFIGLANYSCDGALYLTGGVPGAMEDIVDIIGDEYSELSGKAMVVPEVSDSTILTPISWKTYYPFDESLDDYDLALLMEIGYATSDEFAAYKAALTQAGFELGENGRTYELKSDLIGEFEITPSFAENQSLSDGKTGDVLAFQVFFTAPESYTSHLTVEMLRLQEVLGLTLDIHNDDDPSSWAYVNYKAEGIDTAPKAMEALARILIADGYNVKTTSELIPADDEYPAYYKMSFNKAEVNLSLFVDEAANQDGSFTVEIDLLDGKQLELSNAELAAQAAFKGIYDKLALKGVDYVENADGTFSFVTSGGQGSADQLKSISESKATILGDSFALANSEADGESAWVATFNDVENNVQAKVTASIDGEGNISVSFSFENHKFVTPETTMVAFLTELNGAAPSASDYLVDDQDGSCLAEFALDGTHEASELQGLAEGLIAKFGEGFEKVTSEADATTGNWAVLIQNEDTGVEAQIVAGIDADGKVTVDVLIGWIPEAPQIRADEEAMIAILTNLWGSVEDGDYSYNEQNDLYVAGWYIFNSDYGDASYNQSIASNIASLAPEGFSTVQAGAASVASENDAYRVILYNSSTGVVVQITVFVHPKAGKNVFQILTYLN